MGFLQGRRILVTGMLSNRSIAYGIAKACQREGAELAFTYQGEGIRERVRGPGDASSAPTACSRATWPTTRRSTRSSPTLGKHWDGLDGLVHAIAFAPREALKGGFHESVTREAFRIAHDISSYSLAALAKAAAPMMAGPPRLDRDALLPGRRARDAELQRDGARQGEPRGRRALPRREPGARGHPRERDLRRADQDARRGGHRRLLEDPALRREERAAAPRRDAPRRSATPPPSCSPTSPAASPAR